MFAFNETKDIALRHGSPIQRDGYSDTDDEEWFAQRQMNGEQIHMEPAQFNVIVLGTTSVQSFIDLDIQRDAMVPDMSTDRDCQI